MGRASRLLFVAALLLASFAGGMYVTIYKFFPYDVLFSARKTFLAAVETNRLGIPRYSDEFVDVPPEQAAARRFEFIGSDRLADPILVPGGWGQFQEHCPDHAGCIAVEYAGRGEVRHAWPYRPEELEKWLEKEEFARDFPYEHAIGFSFSRHARIRGVSRYSNGDLLVVFGFLQSYPHGGGVARIDRSGKPVWYRPDYSHHRPHLADGEVALVPGHTLPPPLRSDTSCPDRIHDTVNAIDPEGMKLEEIAVFDAVLKSSYAGLLRLSNTCNPIHLNAIHLLREDVRGPGLEPGDLVVSMRNMNAFAILDHRDRRLKRLVRDRFFQQHAVLHFKGSRFLMLDNQGGTNADGTRIRSRLLMVDVASGEETTIFPNHRTPPTLREPYSHQAGGLAISPDRSRAMVTFTAQGKAVEVWIADGEVLVVFHSIHYGSRLDELSDERTTRAVRRRLSEIRYSGDG